MSSPEIHALPCIATTPEPSDECGNVPDASCVTVGIVAPVPNAIGPFLIVARRGLWQRPQASYRAAPEAWQQIGLLGGDGRLQRVTAAMPVWRSLLDREPLACGHSFQVSSENHND